MASPPGMFKWKSIRSKHTLEEKIIKYKYSKVFEDQSDTYHDTRTHYLMEQDPSLLQDHADVMDVVVANKVEALKNEGMGPPGPCLSRFGSRYSMSRTCGPRDIISSVIPWLGDNRPKNAP